MQVEHRIVRRNPRRLVVIPERRRVVPHFPGDDGEVETGEEVVPAFPGQEFEDARRALEVLPEEKTDALDEQGVQVPGADAPVPGLGPQRPLEKGDGLVGPFQLEGGEAEEAQRRREGGIVRQGPPQARGRLLV